MLLLFLLLLLLLACQLVQTRNNGTDKTQMGRSGRYCCTVCRRFKVWCEGEQWLHLRAGLKTTSA